MGTGFFKIDRAIFDSDIWAGSEPYDRRSAWIYLIGMANYKQSKKVFKGQTQVTERGQLQTSIEKLAEEWKWSRGKVRRYIRHLERHSMVHTCGTPLGTTITIENYAIYQDTRPAMRPSNRPTDGSADGTHKKNSKEIKEGEEAPPDFQTGPESIGAVLEGLTAEDAKRMVEEWEREVNRSLREDDEDDE